MSKNRILFFLVSLVFTGLAMFFFLFSSRISTETPRSAKYVQYYYLNKWRPQSFSAVSLIGLGSNGLGSGPLDQLGGIWSAPSITQIASFAKTGLGTGRMGLEHQSLAHGGLHVTYYEIKETPFEKVRRWLGFR